jgi:hypothetical protein
MKKGKVIIPGLITDLRNVKAEVVAGSFKKGDLTFRKADTPPELLSVLKKVYSCYEDIDIVK